jgi:hypothetical protein
MSDKPVEKETQQVPAYYEALDGLVNQAELNKDIKEKILQTYTRRPQEYEEQPWRMQNYLEALGVREKVAKWLTTRFWSITRGISLDYFEPQENQAYPYQPFPAYPQQQRAMQPQYPVTQPPEDQDMKMMRFMMMMKMFNQPAQSNVDPMQQFMQMMAMSGGRMGLSQEPVLDSTGKPMIDATGNVVMRFTMVPSTQQSQNHQPDPTIELFKEMLRSQTDQKRVSDDRYYLTLEKQKAIEDEMREKENRALRRRLAMIEQERGPDRLIEDIKRLKEVGLYPAVGGASSPNIDALKLQTDLERWKYERETDLQRWQRQQDMDARKWYKELELEEARENRTQDRLGMLGETLKDTLTNVVTPVLQSAAAGAMSGVQAKADTVAPPDVSKMDDQSLMAQYQEVQKVGEKVITARELLEVEMRRRMEEKKKMEESAKKQQEAVATAATTVRPSVSPAIDISSLKDTGFDAPPTLPIARPAAPNIPKTKEEDEEDEGPGELVLNPKEASSAYDKQY